MTKYYGYSVVLVFISAWSFPINLTVGNSVQRLKIIKLGERVIFGKKDVKTEAEGPFLANSIYFRGRHKCMGKLTSSREQIDYNVMFYSLHDST